MQKDHATHHKYELSLTLKMLAIWEYPSGTLKVITIAATCIR